MGMGSTHIAGPGQIREAYQRVKQRIAEAAHRSGRKGEDIAVVAVTKHATPDQIRAIVELGQMDLGENRAQQLQQRVAMLDEYLQRRRTLGAATTRGKGELPDRVRWHMIGHMQRNKVKQVVPLINLIHSVDSLRLCEELHTFGSRLNEPIDILLQVNASGEPSKYGVALPAAIHLAEQIDSMVNLRLRGLMTMAPQFENPEDARPTFTRTTELFAEIHKAGIGGNAFRILSMGMSNDFEIAIEEGANLVRLGRILFGEGDGAPDEQDDD